MTPPVRLTMLNDMAHGDFEMGLDRLQSWNIRDLDLRTNIYGYSVGSLPSDLAKKAAASVQRRGMTVYSMSTTLLVGDITRGRDVVRTELDDALRSALRSAAILRPRFVRLLAGQWPGHPKSPGIVTALLREYPWVTEEYRRAADAILTAGFTPILENEATECFLSHPEDMAEFLDTIDITELRFTWDVQNQWATGVFPQPADLDLLAPWMSFYHVKGAKGATMNPTIPEWNVALEDSTWPVTEITQAVVDRNLSPVICLNPTQHGKNIKGYDYLTVPERDLRFLRSTIRGIA